MHDLDLGQAEQSPNKDKEVTFQEDSPGDAREEKFPGSEAAETKVPVRVH